MFESLFVWPPLARSLGSGAVTFPSGYLTVNGQNFLLTGTNSTFLEVS